MKNKILSILLSIGFNLQDAEIISQDIITTYNKAERGYHDLTHISKMLHNFDSFILNSAFANKIYNINEFAFAVIMHDYVNGTKNDIELSVTKAKQFLHRISKNYNCAYIEKLIRATDYEKIMQTDFEQQLMQDLDLLILGSNSAEYDVYAAKIRAQYNEFSDTTFNPNRIKILNIFLNRSHIYNITYFRDKYEKNARNNLNQEIQHLSN